MDGELLAQFKQPQMKRSDNTEPSERFAQRRYGRFCPKLAHHHSRWTLVERGCSNSIRQLEKPRILLSRRTRTVMGRFGTAILAGPGTARAASRADVTVENQGDEALDSSYSCGTPVTGSEKRSSPSHPGSNKRA